MSKGKQIGLIILTAIAYLYLAVTRDNMSIGAIALMLIVLVAGMSILAFFINQVIKLFKKWHPSFGTTFRVCIFLYLVLLCFDNSAPNNKNVKEETYTDTDLRGLNDKKHNCTYCGKEYVGAGFFHVANECIQSKSDPGYNECCTEKCCYDSWRTN